MSSNSNKNEYVSLVMIPSKWFYLFVWIFSTIIVLYTLVELLTNRTWTGLGETAYTRMAVLMTLIVGWFFILTHIWEVIMLGYAKIFKEKVYAEGKADGIAEGKAEGRAEGKAEVYRELVAWEKRRRETEARGEIFTEPLPIPKPEESENTDNK